ncbi:ABC transporter ATP-binding protein [Glycomyces sp. A-F 0318]|uniref:ABC transporter ATP-binding protein n=1 Tax=Glycomyces amatae TaxID=2881355 RepID=UPI001E62AA46|nr:ABC transporter ATP-binding protein [Glycomyces amatae]MCD0443547.1 ABC transporter ATP-binding protein [Glycomyces amatae]
MPEPPPPALAISGLSYAIGDRVLFDGLDLALAAGESVSILGSSGSGKSTLLSMILGLLQADSGTVSVDGEDLGGLGAGARARLRARAVGMVFQFGELLPELSPRDNVALAAMLAGADTTGVHDRAAGLLRRLGVPEAATVETLSGGERQRVAVARALVNEPRLLLADEPTGALDEENRDKVAELLFALPAERDCALLVVTHDRSVAYRADRVLAITGGSLRPAARGGTGR